MQRADAHPAGGAASKREQDQDHPQGGMVVFNYGMGNAIGVNEDITRFMFKEFDKRKSFWQAKQRP